MVYRFGDVEEGSMEGTISMDFSVARVRVEVDGSMLALTEDSFWPSWLMRLRVRVGFQREVEVIRQSDPHCHQHSGNTHVTLLASSIGILSGMGCTGQPISHMHVWDGMHGCLGSFSCG